MTRVFISAALTLAAVGHVVADSPLSRPSLEDDTPATKRAIPVPKRNQWKHKTLSPDRKLFAIYFRHGWDEVISIHDATTGEQLQYMADHGDDVVEFKFSDDGKLLASRCINRYREGWAVWDVRTGKLLFRLFDPKAGRQGVGDGNTEEIKPAP